MLISVTPEDIANASPLPCSSPIALAITRITGKQVVVNHVAAYVGGDRYELPAIARKNEMAFDYFSKAKDIQGKHLEAIQSFEFEL